MARPKGSLAQPSGLAFVEKVYFEKGQEAARSALRTQLGPQEELRPFHVVELGQSSLRTDVRASDRILYTNFSAPANWSAPYSVHLVSFENEEKTDYMFHSGEELIVPISGKITYHFFWTPGEREPQRILLQPPLKTGSMVRINPQIPHHTWSTTPDGASAWMIFRNASNSPAALLLDENTPSDVIISPRRRISADQLRQPGRYALIAWGIAELVREARQRAGWTTKDLAEQVQINPSSLSRLEEAKANVSVGLLLRICRALRIGILDRIASGSWAYDIVFFPEKRRKIAGESLVGSVFVHEHSLHPTYFKLRRHDEISVHLCLTGEIPGFASWIILAGRVLLELPESFKARPVVLDEGNVIHFRQHGRGRLKALEDTCILGITYSQAGCDCNSPRKAR